MSNSFDLFMLGCIFDNSGILSVEYLELWNVGCKIVVFLFSFTVFSTASILQFDDRARRVGTVDADNALKVNGVAKETEKIKEVKLEAENGEEIDIDDI